MTSAILRRLTSDDFVASLACVATPGGLRRALSRREEVLLVRRAIAQGEVTESSIRRFVSDLLCDFKRDERFPHEVALAAIAVAVEKRVTDFVEEFMLDLARLKLAELPLAIRVARECLKFRASLTRNQRITYVANAFHRVIPRNRVNGGHPSGWPGGVSTIYRSEVV